MASCNHDHYGPPFPPARVEASRGAVSRLDIILLFFGGKSLE